jgi:DNA gyrase inhibitor GyrI
MFQAKEGQYIGHAMPAGATAVHKSEETGKRQSQSFEFFYNGWKQENPTRENCRFGASRDELFPPDRQVQ